MIGELDEFMTLFGAVPDGGVKDWNKRVAAAMITAGLGVVLIKPGDKTPACILTAGQAKGADKLAQDEAKAAGSPNWERVRHRCGVHHAITDAKVLNLTRPKELLAAGCNLAVAPGASTRRIIVVDVDTAGERDGFLLDWAAGSGVDAGRDYLRNEPMTVTSPGSRALGPDGATVWAHKDGGHFWFLVPEGQTLPDGGTGKYRAPAGWVAYFGSGYVLVPPSVRAEGPYRVTGQIHQAPAWLLDQIHQAVQVTPYKARELDGDDPIDVWSADTTWEDILIPEGFTRFDHDACGCPTWTRPGAPAHAKSATAHEPGCTQYDTSLGHGPLHLWSDELVNGSGQRTISKLTALSRFRFAGNVSAAMAEIGLAALPNQALELDSLDEELGHVPGQTRGLEQVPKESAPAETGDDVPELDDLGELAEVEADRDRFAPLDWVQLFTAAPEPAQFLPASLLERGQQASLIGDGKSGKSLLIFDWCWHAISGQPFLDEVVIDPIKILYLDAENSRRDLLGRARAFGTNPEVLAEHLVYLSFPPFNPLDTTEGAQQALAIVAKHRPDVVILDTVSRFVQGNENDSDTWLALYRKLHRGLKAAGIACLRLDHFGKDAERGGRGSSAKTQDIDHVWELHSAEPTEESNGGEFTITTALTLRRTHTRSGLGPDQIAITRTGVMNQARDMWLPGRTRHTTAVSADPFAGRVDVPTDLMADILAFLARNPGSSRAAVETAVRGRRERIRLALELMAADGRIQETEGPRRALTYRLTDDGLLAIESGELS